MKKTVLVLALLLCAPVLADSSADQIAHGKYLVENVAGCADCHTPRLKNGQPDTTHAMQGAVLDFAPLHPIPHWAKKAPPIAGLKKWSDADAVKFLMTGLDKKGEHADPPMPVFKFNEADAKAVVAYLRSLK